MLRGQWNIKDAIKVFFVYIILMFVGMPIIMQAAYAIFGHSFMNSVSNRGIVLFFSFFINVLICIYIVYIVNVEHHQSIQALGLSTVNLSNNIKVGIRQYVITLPFIIIVGFIINLISSYYGVSPETQDVVKWVMEEKSRFLLGCLIFFGVILAPVMEEILFRGFLQSALRNSFGDRYAVAISAFLFAGVHMDVFAFLQIFILGLLLGYLYEKTQTLAASIFVHITHNSLTLIFLLYFKFFLKGKMPAF